MSLRACRRTRLYHQYPSSVSNCFKLRFASTATTFHHDSAKSLNRELAYYWDTAPPTATQLRRADKFFGAAPPKLLFSATKFWTVNRGAVPEVAFLGRSNVGKSSLLNALMGQKICHTSSKPGRTRSMNFFAVGGEDSRGNLGKMALLDLPGYGKGSREEWGLEIMKYFVGRKQLRRVFLLVDALHGLRPSDEEILSLFRQNAISHQVILSKVDRILFAKSRPSLALMEQNTRKLDQLCQDLRCKIQPGNGDGPEALGEILTCSAEANLQGKKLGVNNIRWAMLAATGLGEEKKKLLSSDLPSDIPDDSISIGDTKPPASISER